MQTQSPQVWGVDFSSAPSRRKPITVVRGRLRDDGCLALEAFEALDTLDDFDRLLRRAGPWVGGFDLPLGLPRELVLALGWPQVWPDLVRHFAAQPRARLREHFIAFCAARPKGGKFAHRATDRPAGSSPSMKWVNPPVAWMFHAGAPRLLEAGVHLPGLCAGDPARVALEAYPGMLARAITTDSYKSDTVARQDEARRDARTRIRAALLAGDHPLGLRVADGAPLAQRLADDPRGDWLEALLCAVQAAWALAQGPGYGLPATIDPLEGWIVGAPCVPPSG